MRFGHWQHFRSQNSLRGKEFTLAHSINNDDDNDDDENDGDDEDDDDDDDDDTIFIQSILRALFISLQWKQYTGIFTVL